MEHLYGTAQEGEEGTTEADKMFMSIMDTVKFDEQFGSGKWADIGRLIRCEDAIESRRQLLIACAIQAFQQLDSVNCMLSPISYSMAVF